MLLRLLHFVQNRPLRVEVILYLALAVGFMRNRAKKVGEIPDFFHPAHQVFLEPRERPQKIA